jgi:hypothetical protein
MKKDLWGAAIFATIVFLTLMGKAQAFDAADIQFSEYRIVGTATQSMVTSTEIGPSIQYMGKSYLEGFIVELDGRFEGHGEMSLDYGTMLQFPDLITNYYCEFTVAQYDWDSEKNKLIDKTASIACYDPRSPDTDMMRFNGCLLVLDFSDVAHFTGMVVCKDLSPDGVSTIRSIGRFRGTELGKYNPLLFQSP